jgi:DNA-binding ferritin-like protein (Dps family)
METNAKNHQQVVADYEAHIEKLHDDYAKQMKDLQEHMNEQCSADLGDLQKQLEDQFNGILEEAHQAHKTAKEEMAEAHK